MPAHKFTVGQRVRFTPDPGHVEGRSQNCIILRLLPETDSVPQYQVKSDLDGRVHVVRETQLMNL